LRATLAWSYDLLTSEEQRLFRCLAIFSGGCTLEAAEALYLADVGSGQPARHSDDVLDLATSLVDKSLVRRADGSDGPLRLTLLETVREYGLEQLEVLGEAAAARRRHLEWYLALAQRLHPDRTDPADVARLERE